MGGKRWYAVGRFVVFGVLLSLLPLFAVYLIRTVATVSNPAHPFGQGSLFLLATTTAFSAVGGLLARHPTAPAFDHPVVARLAAAVAGLNGLLAAVLYGSVSNTSPLHGHTILVLSGIQYVITVLAGGACVVLAEER